MSALFLALFASAPLLSAQAGTPNAAAVSEQIARAHELIDQWQIDEAEQIARALEKQLPDVPPVQALVGTVKFQRGDFEGAVAHLRRAAEGGGDPYLLQLAERTLKETQGNVTHESAHFVVRTPPGKDEILGPLALDALEKAYQALSVAFDHTLTHKIVVDIVHDPRGLANVSSLTVKEIETSGTIALCKYDRLMVTSPKAIARGYSWLDTMSHELVHLMVSQKSKNQVPVWLHEGLAKFNETRWRGPPGLALEPASENLLAGAVKKGTLITFDQMHPSMAKLPSQEDAALAFAEVFTVIEWIEADMPQRNGKRATTILLEELGNKKSMDEALTAAIGMNLEGMQKEWKQYLKRRAFKLAPGAEPEKLTFVKNARSGTANVEEKEDEAALGGATKELKEARSFVRLGNLLRNKRRLEAASVEYEKARALGVDKNPALNNRLAGMYVELGKLDRAQKLLGDTVTVFPDDPQTRVLLGRVALRAENWAEARTQYERATREGPFNPEIWVALAKIADAQKDAKLSAQAVRAIELLRGDVQRSGGIPGRARDGEPAGVVSIASEPWGRVIVNGRETGLMTPVVDLRLKPGAYRVRVVDPVTGKEEGRALEVVEGKTERVSITLRTLSASERERLIAEEGAALAPPLPAPKPVPTAAPKEPSAPWEIDDESPGGLDELRPIPR
jgi:tetratricopeptide (TPR) repeat protein